jgi:hypothetical protein
MRRLLLLGSMLLTLGGCTVYGQYWDSPNGTEAAFDAAASGCDKAAFVRYPPVTMGVPGYFSTPNEFCGPTAGGTNCMIINDGYLPQVQSADDTNAQPRGHAFQSCMVAGGWHPVYAANGLAFTPPMSVPAPAPRP